MKQRFYDYAVPIVLILTGALVNVTPGPSDVVRVIWLGTIAMAALALNLRCRIEIMRRENEQMMAAVGRAIDDIIARCSVPD